MNTRNDVSSWLARLSTAVWCVGMIFGGSQALGTEVGVPYAWGRNDYGQLGDETTTQRRAPVQSHGLSDVVAIYAGDFHNFAVKTDGTVWAWGHNEYGQLGDGTTQDRPTPVRVIGLANIRTICAGGQHSLAVKDDGTLWAWGSNWYGQLGDGTTTYRMTPVQVVLEGEFQEVTAGINHSMAVKSDGTVWTWGNNDDGQLGDGATTNRTTPAQIDNLAGVRAVSAKGNHSLAVKTDGMVWAWGNNDYGGLGDGTTTDRNTPVQVSGLSGVASVSTGALHSLALKADGTVWAWGYNAYGQLGDGTTADQHTPVQSSSLSDVTVVSAGGHHSLANMTDGTVWAWGYNNNGQLGDGTTTNRSTPGPVNDLVNVQSVCAGDYHSLALNPPSFYCIEQPYLAYSGRTFEPAVKVVSDSPVTLAIKSGTGAPGAVLSGTLTVSPIDNVATFSDLSIDKVGTGYVLLATNGESDPAYSQPFDVKYTPESGDPYAWGYNAFYQIGDGTNLDRNMPVQVYGLKSINAVSAGYIHNLVIDDDRTAWSWGDNAYGQLGDGTIIDRFTPVRVINLDNVHQVSAGTNHNVALKADGTAWAWGYNGHGELGDGTTYTRHSPVMVDSPVRFQSVSAGSDHSLALGMDGTVWAWGTNNSGQLGDGTTSARYIPVQVVGLSDVTAVSAGNQYSIALRADGTVWSWGWNGNGRLGDGTYTQRYAPVQVNELSAVQSVSAGYGHSLALKGDGTVWAWGNNYYGGLGDGTTIERIVPVQTIGLTDVKAIAVGDYHSLALTTDGKVYSWGWNEHGQLGVGTWEDRSTPVMIAGISSASMISAGYAHSLAIKAYGTPAHLVFSSEPSIATKAVPFDIQPVLLARDATNNLIADYTGPVTLSIKAGTGTPEATLGGTTTVYAVGGVATFTDLSIDKKGTGYVLEASVGGTVLGESAPFNVTPKAERLMFTTQPALATDDWPFGVQPVVTAQDTEGETATLYNGSVTLAVKPGTGAEGAVLTGVTTISAPQGVAGFTGLGIPKVGAGYVLTAYAEGLTSAESAPFDVAEAPKLVPAQVPPDTVEITLRPAGQTITMAGITLDWDADDLNPVAYSDVTPAEGWTLDSFDASSGLTVFLSHQEGVSTNGPALSVRFTARPGVSGRPIPVTVTGDSYLMDAGFNNIPVLPRTVQFIPGAHLAFTQQPVMTTAGQAIAGQPTVAMMDGTGALVAAYDVPMTVSIKPGTGTEGAVLGGTTTLTPSSGVSVFTDLTIDRKGFGYVLTAASGPLTVDSLPFDISPRALKLAFTTQPGATRAGLPIQPHPAVTVQDEEGSTAFAYSGLVTLAIKPGTGYPGAVLGGATTLNAEMGIATFSNVNIGSAAPGYMLLASGQSLTGAESTAFDITAFTFTLPDVRDALRWSAGLSTMPPGYLNRFDVVTNGSITLADAVRISRKVVGLEGNP